MTTRSKSLVRVVGSAVAVLALAACSAESSSEGGSASPEITSAAADVIEPLKGEIDWPEPAELSAPIDLSGKTVWWVPIGDAVPSIHSTGVGFTEAVEAAGGEVKLCDGKFNPSDIGNCLKSAGDQNADAVVTYYVDYNMIPNAFDALVDQGVPLLVGAAEARKPATDTLAFSDSGPLTIAVNEVVAASAITASGSAPSGIAIMLNDTPATTKATQAMADKWKELCPDCPLATVKHTTANQDKLSSAISAELVKNPKAKVILSPDDSLVPAITQAVKGSGRNDVNIVSSMGNLPNMQNVLAGSQHADVGLPTAYLGWALAGALFQLVTGDEVAPPPLVMRYFDAENTKDLDLTPEAYESTKWYGDDSFKAAFQTAWGIR